MPPRYIGIREAARLAGYKSDVSIRHLIRTGRLTVRYATDPDGNEITDLPLLAREEVLALQPPRKKGQ